MGAGTYLVARAGHALDPLVPAPGTRENRRRETIIAALLCRPIFVGTRTAGTQGRTHPPSHLDSRLRGSERRRVRHAIMAVPTTRHASLHPAQYPVINQRRDQHSYDHQAAPAHGGAVRVRDPQKFACAKFWGAPVTAALPCA